MDKYEFSLKMEQMKKLIHEEDYLTALKIVEGIDWNRVRNTNLLTMAATVFEKNDRLEEAKEILNLALDRAPVGKRLLYKLCELAVRTGELDQAEDYYYEFRQVDPEDIGNYVLQYMILKARHAPYDRQLQPLELYCQADPDERWLYELATTYEFAGRIEDCIRICDRIALLYGDSQYSIKALRLKMRYADLTDVQKNMLYPRSVPQQEYAAADADAQYEKGYGSSERGAAYGGADQYNGYQNADGREYEARDYRNERNPYAEYGITKEPDPRDAQALKQEPSEEYAAVSADDEAARRNSDALAAARYENEDAEFDAYVRKLEARMAEQRAADEARRAEEAKRAAAQRADAERIAAERSAELKKKAMEQQAAMQRAAQAAAVKSQQTAVSEAAETVQLPSDTSEPVAEEPENSHDDGQQMAFDFGAGDVKVVEEPDMPDENTEASGDDARPQSEAFGYAADTVSSTAQAGAAEAAASVAAVGTAVQSTRSTIAAVEAALNGTAPAVNVQQAPAAEQQAAQPARQIYTDAAAQSEPQQIIRSEAVVNPKAAALKAADEERPTRTVSMKKFHMIVEADTIADGISIAVDELKAVHEENGIQHASAKTTAAKLNEIGFTDSIINKIRDKDFVIEKAGDLDKDIIEDIYNFIRTDRSGTIVVMIDTPEGLDNIEDVRPELFDICDYISDIDDEEFEEKESKKAVAAYEAEADDEDEPEEDDDIDDDLDDDDPYDDDEDFDDEEEDSYEEDQKHSKKEPQKRSAGKVREKFSNVREVVPVKDGEQMEIDDFAQYCTQYASEIDCSITGKSMLALYERIELMEEDGIPLTKENAEQLIEEAADRAEKPPIGKRLSGVFHSKYDKNGCLILKEDDFIH